MLHKNIPQLINQHNSSQCLTETHFPASSTGFGGIISNFIGVLLIFNTILCHFSLQLLFWLYQGSWCFIIGTYGGFFVRVGILCLKRLLFGGFKVLVFFLLLQYLTLNQISISICNLRYFVRNYLRIDPHRKLSCLAWVVRCSLFTLISTYGFVILVYLWICLYLSSSLLAKLCIRFFWFKAFLVPASFNFYLDYDRSLGF